MKKLIIRTLCLALGLCIACLLPLTLGSCGAKQTVLLELDGQTMTVNEYEFLLSRVKGTLDLGGYSVNSSSFWDTIVNSDGTTYNEYVTQMALGDARQYLAAAVIFEQEGLSLADETIAEIDTQIDDMIAAEEDSKTALNAVLAGYGVNVDILRDLYILEAKFKAVQQHLYGTDGEKVAAPVRQEYLEENAVAFRQIIFRAYRYVYETDENGDEIYYAVENDGEATNIAYDTMGKGTNPEFDEYGKEIKDANGDVVYYYIAEDGSKHIAYDKEKGTRAVCYDEDGNVMTEKYTAEELAGLKEEAREILAMVEPGDYPAFEAVATELDASGEEMYEVLDELAFLYTTGDNGNDLLNDIADALAPLEEGDLTMIDSELGYTVLMKYALPSDAAANTDYEDWLQDLGDRVVEKLFFARCADLIDAVVVDTEALAKVRSMMEITSNYYY